MGTSFHSSGLIVYVGRSLHTYWDWVSMLILMQMEPIIYFVFVFRILLPVYFIFHTRMLDLKGTTCVDDT